MVRVFTAIFALAVALAWATGVSAQQSHSKHRHVVRAGSVGVMEPGEVYSAPGHYRALVGDPGSGAGFYPLPYQYRVGAWRHRMETQEATPPWVNPNPVIAAAQAQSVRYWGWGDPTPAESYHYGVYNPIDGVGSPFFAGYYGPADPDADEDDFPFGRPYGP